jgi:hypothetical protein
MKRVSDRPTKPGIRRIGHLTVGSLALLLLCACAVNHSENFVSVVMKQDAAANASPLSNVDIVFVDSLFGATTSKGKLDLGMEQVANRQVLTLLPALRRQMPVVLKRNGIDARAVPAGQRSSADNVLTIEPKMAQNLQDAHGAPVVGIKLTMEIRDRAGALVWSGFALEREDSSRTGAIGWSDAMAEDMARTLLIRLRKDGFAKFGTGPDAAPL